MKKIFGSWRVLAPLPGVGAALLPVGLCPLCWPAYAGFLGSLGLGFLFESVYLVPVTVGFLGFALFALAFRARTRRGYVPFVLGIVSSIIIVGFKFVFPFSPLAYMGLFGLVAASVWNSWPKRKSKAVSCPNCVQQETAG